MTAATIEATRTAYARWAPRYPPEPHNPLMHAEQAVVLELCPDVVGCTVLDLGCGSGRYAKLLAERGASMVVATDFCMPMLERVQTAQRVCAGMTNLPFADQSFDIVVCGLAVGHMPDFRVWADEAARVLRPGGSLVYSDFHPDAAKVRLTRSFRDEQQQHWTVPHFRHDLTRQLTSLRKIGLTAEVREVRVGRELTQPFKGSEAFYNRWGGLSLVLAVRADK